MVINLKAAKQIGLKIPPKRAGEIAGESPECGPGVGKLTAGQ
jgi:hypothetical protein